jgi:tRNA-specific 2-thiouridylase
VADSAVALLRAGPDAVGVTLRPGATWPARCAPGGALRPPPPLPEHVPRAWACKRTLDLREEFRRAVVQPFEDGYEAGETPNPCIRCNGAFRFDELLAFTERAGADELWTGHYARIVERDGARLVARAVDREMTTVHARDRRSALAACGSRSASR